MYLGNILSHSLNIQLSFYFLLKHNELQSSITRFDRFIRFWSSYKKSSLNEIQLDYSLFHVVVAQWPRQTGDFHSRVCQIPGEFDFHLGELIIFIFSLCLQDKEQRKFGYSTRNVSKMREKWGSECLNTRFLIGTRGIQSKVKIKSYISGTLSDSLTQIVKCACAKN